MSFWDSVDFDYTKTKRIDVAIDDFINESLTSSEFDIAGRKLFGNYVSDSRFEFNTSQIENFTKEFIYRLASVKILKSTTKDVQHIFEVEYPGR